MTLPNLPKSEIIRMIEAQIPKKERALDLIDAYYSHVGWFCRPVERDQIVGEIVPLIYGRARKRLNPEDDEELERFI